MKAYERLIKYAEFPTASDESREGCPSTPEQLVFGRYLVEEMKSLGVADASMDENGYVFGTLPSNIPGWSGTVIGLIAHMDIVREVAFENIKLRVIENYDGGDIVLNTGKNILLSPRDYPSLRHHVGKRLLVTDGTTLMGADDKAGIAEIMTLLEHYRDNPGEPHGTLKIGFTPDEEIGRGADLFDVARFGADYAYTLDGGSFGEVEFETFNAAAARVSFHGISTHPGSAKDTMKNAALMAMEFNSLLPSDEIPAKTEGYEGFFHLTDMRGACENATLSYILRDHDAAVLERRKRDVETAVREINRRYGEGSAEADIRDSYRNMAEMIRPHWHLIDNAFTAIRDCGTEPQTVPVRGGTDGSRLSYMGLPCPNLPTGGYNGHGRMEYAAIDEMESCVEMLRSLVRRYIDFKE